MVKDLTRSKFLQIWFTAVILIAVAGIASGGMVSLGTAVMLLGVCLVTPAIVLMLWPRPPSITVGEILRADPPERTGS